MLAIRVPEAPAAIEEGQGALGPAARPGLDVEPHDSTHSEPPRSRVHGLRIVLEGARESATIEPSEPLVTRSNYFLGDDPSQWRTDIPNYGALRYRELAPGVDMVLHGSPEGRIEYDFVVAPGTAPELAVRFEGAERVSPRRGRRARGACRRRRARAACPRAVPGDRRAPRRRRGRVSRRRPGHGALRGRRLRPHAAAGARPGARLRHLPRRLGRRLRLRHRGGRRRGGVRHGVHRLDQLPDREPLPTRERREPGRLRRQADPVRRRPRLRQLPRRLGQRRRRRHRGGRRRGGVRHRADLLDQLPDQGPLPARAGRGATTASPPS
ncbi:MAG: hypothetical protein M5U28_10745 [Sandaracinaceae bacterium]|nr:hypothetical protein [Sandaracinaceae bacterium]